MSDFRFSVIVTSPPMTHEEILDATDALGEAGCADASIRGHDEGMELLFERGGDSMHAAIASAVGDVERAGFAVAKVEMLREAIVA
ncbi:MAG: hypothetical protein RH917_03400 [Lacipirellulaceae bacterium]